MKQHGDFQAVISQYSGRRPWDMEPKKQNFIENAIGSRLRPA
jgi:hypothetical protein